jgi:preprotein translocase subunit SecF
MPTDQMIDLSINAVLPRTIMTATTVFLALLSLAIFGGHVIRSFSLAMIWGIFVATYSSVFICSPMLIYLGLRSEDQDKAPEPAPTKSAKAEVKTEAKADAKAAAPKTAAAKTAAAKTAGTKSAAKTQTRAKPKTA